MLAISFTKSKPSQVFLFKFCEIFQNTYSTERLWTGASKPSVYVLTLRWFDFCQKVYLLPESTPKLANSSLQQYNSR